MKTNKEKLISVLSKSIYSLENSLVDYNWHQQKSCNCGIILQAALNLTPQQLLKKWSSSLLNFEKNQEVRTALTWRALTKSSCSATGIPFVGVIKELYEQGVSPAEITHLEFLSNEAILKKAGKSINKSYKVARIWNKDLKITTEKPHKNFLLRLFKPEKSTVKVGGYEEVNLQYYQRKENLVAYLKAWKSILEEDLGGNKTKTKYVMEKKLIQLVAEQRFEEAANLKQRLDIGNLT